MNGIVGVRRGRGSVADGRLGDNVRHGRRALYPEGHALPGRLRDYSDDNAFAEAFNSLFKAELVRHSGPCQSIDDLKFTVAEYVDWLNHRRLHPPIGMTPPVEHEQQQYDSRQSRAAQRERVEPPINPGRNNMP
ncbi:hypothetical protein D8Y23_15455 [Microbacterium enclense]|uniref:Integrase catalytic domain-containing protein n=1 Tax=Microbacterium enclense TaxID=993073 RepID=A0A3S3L4S4_9MICO|nr:IS3 family transposase [Microbacterium enclense]RWR15779.1 hypothetical protein D8Y23_15455 [Microbacterium enclense]